MNYFNRHYRSIDETYLQHWRFAIKQGFMLILAGVAAILHAFLPFILTSFASKTTIALAAVFKKRTAKATVESNSAQISTAQFLSILAEYLSQRNSEALLHYLKPEHISKVINLNMSDKSLADEALCHQINQYLKYSVHTGHPQFFNQLWSGVDTIGVAAEMLIAATNTSMYTYEVAPLATCIELALIRQLSDIVGFPATSGGTFVTGGSNGNLVAMLAARNRCLSFGHKAEDLCVLYSDNAHYSLDIAAMVLGFKQENLFKIPHTKSQVISLLALEERIQQILDTKKVPCFVAVTAGTTVAGVFDPITEVAAITRYHSNCWLHVDAAHGGAVMFTRQHKILLQGAEIADSFVWDAHKTLGAPLICSVLLMKNKKDMVFHPEESDARDYLFHDDTDHETYNLGQSSIQCGRRADCLKLWLMWQHYGTHGLESIVEHLMELTLYAADLVKKNEDLLLICTPVYLNICFLYKPAEELAEPALFYQKIKKTMLVHAITMVNIAKIEGRYCFRLVISHKNIQSKDIDCFFENVLQWSNKCLIDDQLKHLSSIQK